MFSWWKKGFLIFGTYKMRSIWDAILVPTWLHFPSQNPSKSIKKSIPRCIKFWIDFSTDFSSMLARFWRPTWSHVGHIFHPRAVQNGPQHPPKATKTAKSFKNLENDPPKADGVRIPRGLLFGANMDEFGPSYSAIFYCSEARWRDRSFAALWIDIASYK